MSCICILNRFQFTPLREGRHSSAWENDWEVLEFQFTPLREGRRVITGEVIMSSILFQFTPLREGRQSGCVVVYWDIPISIHAPTRGATCARRETRRRLGDFNSRPYARGDCHSQRRIRRSKEYFNSRPYARGDQISCRSYGSSNTISIHAPTRGATCDYENGTRYPSLISIHAPTRGATWRSRK